MKNLIMTINKRRVIIIWIIIIAAYFAINRYSSSPSFGADMRYSEAFARFQKAREQKERWYALSDLAKESFHTGRFDEAQRYADELDKLTPTYQDNWNYGNAIQDANIVHGLLALRAGDRMAAKQHLTSAGASPGSPQMNSFGPNMCLARALLRVGERDAVLAYFEQCRRFWDFHGSDLDHWRFMVSWGITPDFGANLVY